MAFMNVTQLLAGESFDSAHCKYCVEVIRTFFDLGSAAEEKGALQKGYLAEALDNAVRDQQLVCRPDCPILKAVEQANEDDVEQANSRTGTY